MVSTYVVILFFKVNGFEDHILQVDGNNSIEKSVNDSWFTQSSASSFIESVSAIPVLISSRPSSHVFKGRRSSSNKRIVRNNKAVEALNLPVFTVTV